LEILGVERFTVLDDLKIGGTHDRTVRYQGRQYISDLMTGSIEYGALKIAMQLAVYSRSVLYDHRTFERTPLDVDQERALVIHLPAGPGRCPGRYPGPPLESAQGPVHSVRGRP
jgi:hypothetical protein